MFEARQFQLIEQCRAQRTLREEFIQAASGQMKRAQLLARNGSV